MAMIPTIPTDIVVHLGAPDEPAENITVPFIDYIKNVASSEIYSTWPEEAIKANIYSQISYALNRIYTEWYPSKGYDFDITGVTQFDQKFIKGRNIYENISVIVDSLFNDYLRKKGSVNPFFAQYCNGTTVTCDGLSQWGTVGLAEEGKNAIEIIKFYFGDDIELVVDAPTAPNIPSYPDTPLKLGDLGEDVRRMQIYLNRIGVNYPAIPKIPDLTKGEFDKNTENAVKEFQRIFNLTPDGIIGKSTWYKITYIYTSVKKLAELNAEGTQYEDLPRQFSQPLRLGDSGGSVITLQYFLAFIGQFVRAVPNIEITASFDQETKNAVEAFQQYAGLAVTGEVNFATWNRIYDAYRGVVGFLEEEDSALIVPVEPYPGVVLRQGANGPSVKALKTYLNFISRFVFEIPPLPEDSSFGPKTQSAVTAFQKVFDLPVTGQVDEATWNEITDVYQSIKASQKRKQGQYPGYSIEQEG